MFMFTSGRTFTTTLFRLQSIITMSFYINLDPLYVQICPEKGKRQKQKLSTSCSQSCVYAFVHSKDLWFSHACVNIVMDTFLFMLPVTCSTLDPLLLRGNAFITSSYSTICWHLNFQRIPWHWACRDLWTSCRDEHKAYVLIDKNLNL